MIPFFDNLDRRSFLARLRKALDARDLRDALNHLRELAPDYTPNSAVLALAVQCGQRVRL